MSDERMTTEQIAALVAETRNLPDSFTVEADAIDFEPLCSAVEQLQATLAELRLDGYKRGYLYEESSGLGVQIFVRVDRKLTDNDNSTLRHACDGIVDSFQHETIRLDPEAGRRAAQERSKIVALFPQPIFVEEIPNRYCNQPCCSRRPWFVVTTPRGRITIGWRKRVLSIDWSDSAINFAASELFPLEDVTKDGRLIHAWGYEQAAKYIGVLSVEGESGVKNGD
jgi:hypothetical protein